MLSELRSLLDLFVRVRVLVATQIAKQTGEVAYEIGTCYGSVLDRTIDARFKPFMTMPLTIELDLLAELALAVNCLARMETGLDCFAALTTESVSSHTNFDMSCPLA